MNYIHKLIYNYAFIFIATILFYYFLNRNRNKIIKTTIILDCTGLIMLIIPLFLYQRGIVDVRGLFQFIYETISIGVLANAFLCKNKDKFKSLNNLSKNEIIICITAIIFGTFSFLSIFLSNYKYIFPVSGNTHIGNMFFNADIERGINEIFEINLLTSEIHPLYRYLILPIIWPFILVDKMLINFISSYNAMILKACIIVVIQIILNSASAILFYRILKQSKINNKISILGTLLFIFSLPFIWVSIIPETYSLTLLTLLLMIYYYSKNNNLWFGFAVLTFGANLMTAIPIGILLIHYLIKNYKKIKIDKRTKIVVLILITIIIFVLGTTLLVEFINYINTWKDNTGELPETINYSLNKFIIPMILGPNFIDIHPFFVQTNSFNYCALGLFIVFAIIAIIGFGSRFRKDMLINLSFIFLISGYMLHIIIGYGKHNGIIYSPLYFWALLILIINGLNFIYNKYKKTWYLIGMIIILVFIFNVNWVIDFGRALSEEKLSQDLYDLSNKNKVELEYENGETESFIINNGKIIQLSTGNTIISNIDYPWVYSKQNNFITGNIEDSRWFKIYTQENELYINICENIYKIENNNKFYIFGMGLREKYLFVKDEENIGNYYKLIRYSDKKVILNKLTLKNIDYENYKLTATNYSNEDVIIYENENGIYITVGNKTTELGNSIKINIPTFEGYNNKRELRMLFNEVMVNITKDGPKPNFIVYENSWYRDAASIAMVLENTNNISQIENWILNLDSIYDMNNGVKEPDNLGQVLFLISLVEDKNNKLIEEVLIEADKIKTEEGYISGLTDGYEHPVYQTKWLIYGLKSLGLDYSNYKVPDVYDSYENLLWFDKEFNTTQKEFSDRWQYIYFANLHYSETKMDLSLTSYPISYEYRPSKANFENLKILNNNFAENKIVAPHSWSASEMFLYLLYLNEVEI